MARSFQAQSPMVKSNTEIWSDLSCIFALHAVPKTMTADERSLCSKAHSIPRSTSYQKKGEQICPHGPQPYQAIEPYRAIAVLAWLSLLTNTPKETQKNPTGISLGDIKWPKPLPLELTFLEPNASQGTR